MTPPCILCILGAPGSGKGTIGKKLAGDFGFYHLSIGDHLRAERESGRFEDDNEVLDCLEQGRLLPSEKLLPILVKKIRGISKNEHRAIILDGFPRCLKQGQELEDLVLDISIVIQLDCPMEVAKLRFLNRKIPGRLHDDTEDMFARRFKEFEDGNADIAQYYRNKDVFIKVNSSGPTESTYQGLLNAIGLDDRWKILLYGSS